MSDPLRIDIGCGKNKRAGFLGVDQYAMDGVDLVLNVCELDRENSVPDPFYPVYRYKRWPWEDGSVTEVNCSHFMEHLTNWGGKYERVHFLNELYRVLKPAKRDNGRLVEGFCTLTIPHWASQRYYGDPTHKEPFSEFGFYYLDKDWRVSDRDWRAANAPHTDVRFNPQGYSCHLECTWGYTTHPAIQTRSAEYQQHAMTWWLEARQDMVATLCRKD